MCNTVVKTLGEDTVVLVCGGRNYKDSRRVFEELDALEPTLVIEGGASGADQLAFRWAQARQVPVITHFANWKALGRAAGPIRNGEMLARWKPNVVLAFPGGAGTANMVKQAAEHGGIRVVHSAES